jgi:hypothetical protein
MDSKRDEISVSKLKRMMIRMAKEIKEDIQKQSMKSKRISINHCKPLKMSQNLLNELKDDTNI